MLFRSARRLERQVNEQINNDCGSYCEKIGARGERRARRIVELVESFEAWHGCVGKRRMGMGPVDSKLLQVIQSYSKLLKLLK